MFVAITESSMVIPFVVGITLILLATSTAIVAARWKKRCKDRMESPIVEGIPLLPGSHWLLGNLKQIRGTDVTAIQRRVAFDHANDEGLCSFYYARTPVITTIQPKHARIALRTTFKEQPAMMKRHISRLLGKRTLGFMNGKEWKFYRTAVHRAFSPASLEAAQPCIEFVARTLVNSLQLRIDDAVHTKNASSITMEVMPLVKLATLDIFGRIALSENFDGCKELKPSPIATAFEYLCDEMTLRMHSINPLHHFYSIPTKSNLRHRKEARVLRDLLRRVVWTRRAEVARNSGYGHKNDMLSHLLRAFEAQKKTDLIVDGDLSDETFSDILVTLLFAGHDTTSITLAYALHLLAENPEAQAKCLEEIQSILPPQCEQSSSSKDGIQNTTASFDPKDLVYCHAVIYETLRLYPPAANVTRAMDRPTEISSGVVIPKNTTVQVPIWWLQRDERNFPRPLEFLPERWARKDEANHQVWVENLPYNDVNASRRGSCESIDSIRGSISNFDSRRGSCENNDDRRGSMASCSSDSEWGTENGHESKEKVMTEDTKKDDSTIPPGNPSAFFAFSSGARSCLGRKFAIKQAVTILAVLLKDLKFESIKTGYKIEPFKTGLVQKPKDDLPMVIRRR